MSTIPSVQRGNAVAERPALITQELLREMFELRAVAKRQQALRRKLLDLRNAGAVVEEGEYRLMITLDSRLYLTPKRLAEALGEEETERIINSVPLTPVQIVAITQRPGYRRRVPR